MLQSQNETIEHPVLHPEMNLSWGFVLSECFLLPFLPFAFCQMQSTIKPKYKHTACVHGFCRR